jgi:hypothetical protein
MAESDLSILRARADDGDQDAVDELIELAGELGDVDELRRLADQGNATAAGTGSGNRRRARSAHRRSPEVYGG